MNTNTSSFYQESIKKIQKKISLSEKESEQLVGAILNQKIEDVQVAALLSGLSVKGEAISEITGFARGMRNCALQLSHQVKCLVDTAGTGGDGSGTFNISTTAAFVIAGAGISVAKHGNRAISGQCGSADVLKKLGVKIDASKEILEACLAECGITFLFAPAFHQAMKVGAPLRRSLGIRTIFNLLGPLLNPAGARRQIIGVFSPHLTETYGQVLESLGCEHVLVFSGFDGLDEISISGPTKVTEIQDGLIKNYEIHPEDFGIQKASIEEIQGGDTSKNANIMKEVLELKCQDAKRDIVLLNAAAGIYVSGVVESINAALESARHSLNSGQALDKLNELIRLSNQGN